MSLDYMEVLYLSVQQQESEVFVLLLLMHRSFLKEIKQKKDNGLKLKKKKAFWIFGISRKPSGFNAQLNFGECDNLKNI